MMLVSSVIVATMEVLHMITYPKISTKLNSISLEEMWIS